MDIKRPPELKSDAAIEDIRVWAQSLYQWAYDLQKWLQFPHFHQIKLYPRSDAPTDATAGVKYYDSDDSKEKTHNGTSWNDNY